jgi:protein-tyrosine phosphatase
MDYSKIEEGLYQGGRFGSLSSTINAVVNLRAEANDPIDGNRIRAYAWFPIEDTDYWPGDKWLEMVTDVIASFRQQGFNVLVHCAAGISRASMVMCGYLIRHRGMTYDQAMKHITTRRPLANPNETFTMHLKEYSRKMRGS